MDTAIRYLINMTLVVPFYSVYQMVNNIDYSAVSYYQNIIIRIFAFFNKFIKPASNSRKEITGAFSIWVCFIHF